MHTQLIKLMNYPNKTIFFSLFVNFFFILIFLNGQFGAVNISKYCIIILVFPNASIVHGGLLMDLCNRCTVTMGQY